MTGTGDCQSMIIVVILVNSVANPQQQTVQMCRFVASSVCI